MRARALAIAVVVLSGANALAQHVVVFVNGEPITAIDIEQRSKFLLLTTQKPAPRQEVLDALIDEILKVREGARWGIIVPDSDVDNSYAAMASRMGRTPDQLTQELASKGVNSKTLKARIRADIVWQQLVRGRYSARLQLSDKDVQSAIETKGGDATSIGFDYTLRPILFFVRPGSDAAAYDSRRRDAEALRKTFRGCTESIPGVRAMRDVAVRATVVRTSADLPEELRKILDSIPVGQLTPPELTKHGIEMFAVCSKNETRTDTPKLRETKNTLAANRFEQESKRYLRKLRAAAMIERGK
jgi:peptidyl-prolyl cis-trans isomerase SurA